jgi:hypothetical protein
MAPNNIKPNPCACDGPQPRPRWRSRSGAQALMWICLRDETAVLTPAMIPKIEEAEKELSREATNELLRAIRAAAHGRPLGVLAAMARASVEDEPFRILGLHLRDIVTLFLNGDLAPEDIRWHVDVEYNQNWLERMWPTPARKLEAAPAPTATAILKPTGLAATDPASAPTEALRAVKSETSPDEQLEVKAEPPTPTTQPDGRAIADSMQATPKPAASVASPAAETSVPAANMEAPAAESKAALPPPIDATTAETAMPPPEPAQATSELAPAPPAPEPSQSQQPGGRGGRPTDRDMMLEEAAWRLRNQKTKAEGVAAFARELRPWLEDHGEHRTHGDVMKAETIEDHVRSLWNQYRGKTV